MAQVPNIRFNNAVQIPQFGFGVFQIKPEDTATALRTAFDAGYRHIDTAQMYGNEEQVGQAIATSGIARDELFVTTKLNNDKHGADKAPAALDESLRKLGLDHVDLFLIHWPRPAENKYVETGGAFEKLASDGKTRAIGVSNFQVAHLDRLAAETGTVPAVNQIELHPTLQQLDVVQDSRRHGIAVESYSPLGQGADLDSAAVRRIAETHGVTAAQVILRWHLQSGYIVIPKSNTPERIVANLDVTGFELTPDELGQVNDLEAGNRIGGHPASFSMSQIR